jgi:hypothetical protein
MLVAMCCSAIAMWLILVTRAVCELLLNTCTDDVNMYMYATMSNRYIHEVSKYNTVEASCTHIQYQTTTGTQILLVLYATTLSLLLL